MTRASPTDPDLFLVTLYRLRWCAVLGQSVTILVVAYGFGLQLPLARLWAGVVALGLFNAYVAWRLRARGDATAAEVLGHLVVDALILAYLLYLTGGATNPFATLFLLPLALAAMALPRAYAVVFALFIVLVYALLLRKNRALLSDETAETMLRLHIDGTAVDFMLSAALIAAFVSELSATVRRQAASLSREREKRARDEGVLAVATQAATAAHELNTPLATMTILLREMLDGGELPPETADDVRLMQKQVEACRQSVVRLVKGSQRSDQAEQTLLQMLERAVDRCRLLHPALRLDFEFDVRLGLYAVPNDPALEHVFLAVLNNAADATRAGGDTRVEGYARCEDDCLRFVARDYGEGLGDIAPETLGKLFNSRKEQGLGMGLALGHMVLERLGGHMRIQPAQARGVYTTVTIPLSAWRTIP